MRLPAADDDDEMMMLPLFWTLSVLDRSKDVRSAYPASRDSYKVNPGANMPSFVFPYTIFYLCFVDRTARVRLEYARVCVVRTYIPRDDEPLAAGSWIQSTLAAMRIYLYRAREYV